MINKCHTRYFVTEAVARRCSVKKMFLEISQNSQENTCARASFLIKPKACNFIKKETLHKCFLVNFAKFLRTPFSTEHLPWLLLLSDEIQNTKKDENTRIERKEIKKKKKKNRVSCFNIYIVAFAFLSSTVEVGSC